VAPGPALGALLRATVDEAATAAATPKGAREHAAPTLSAFGAVRRLAQDGQLAPTIAAYNEALAAAADALCAEAVASGDGGLPDVIWYILTVMQRAGVTPDATTYEILLQACQRAPKGFAHAEELMEEMLAAGLQPSVRDANNLLSCAKRAGYADAAMRWYLRLPSLGVAPDGHTFSVTLAALRNNWREARRVWVDMETAGVWPDVVTYTAMLCALTQGGEMKRALRLMAQMRAARVQPTSAAFHALAMGWRRTRAWKPASASYNEMVLSGTAVDASTHEVFAALFVEAEDKEMTWLVEQGIEAVAATAECNVYLALMKHADTSDAETSEGSRRALALHQEIRAKLGDAHGWSMGTLMPAASQTVSKAPQNSADGMLRHRALQSAPSGAVSAASIVAVGTATRSVKSVHIGS